MRTHDHAIIPKVVASGRELRLGLPDLGYPDTPDLWDSLHGKIHQGDLVCTTCGADLYLQARDSKRLACTYTKGTPSDDASNESDEHKAWIDRSAEYAERHGHLVEKESRSADGRRRTDLLVRSAEANVALEVQLSPITRDKVVHRRKLAEEDKLTPSWLVVNTGSNVVNRAPWVRFDPLAWRDILSSRALPLQEGVWDLFLERCKTRAQSCPKTRGSARCDGWHVSNYESRRETLETLIDRTASSELVPLVQRRGRSYIYRWVPRKQRDILLDPEHGETPVTPRNETPQPLGWRQQYHATRTATPLALAAEEMFLPLHLRPAPTVQGVSAAGWSAHCSGCGGQWGAVTKASGSHLCVYCAKTKRGR